MEYTDREKEILREEEERIKEKEKYKRAIKNLKEEELAYFKKTIRQALEEPYIWKTSTNIYKEITIMFRVNFLYNKITLKRILEETIKQQEITDKDYKISSIRENKLFNEDLKEKEQERTYKINFYKEVKE